MNKELIKKAFMAGYDYGRSNIWSDIPEIRIWDEGRIDEEIEKFLNTEWGSDEYDYCKGKGYYYIDSKKCDCFCNDLEE